MNLFRPIKKMFHKRWPNKYVLMPSDIEIMSEKEKLIRKMDHIRDYK
ncbi:MAG: hypothetical protein ACTSP6_11150 [Promethearchaeota archaeon]